MTNQGIKKAEKVTFTCVNCGNRDWGYKSGPFGGDIDYENQICDKCDQAKRDANKDKEISVFNTESI